MHNYTLSLDLCMYNAAINGIPHSPTPGLDGEIVDLTEYHVKKLSPGALPDVNTPVYCQELIGG